VAVTQECGQNQLRSLIPKLSSEGRWMDREWGNNLTGRAQKVRNYVYRKKKLKPFHEDLNY